MGQRRRALTTDGQLTWCTASEENMGKRRCNHINHQADGQSVEQYEKKFAEFIMNNPDTYRKIIKKELDIEEVDLDKGEVKEVDTEKDKKNEEQQNNEVKYELYKAKNAKKFKDLMDEAEAFSPKTAEIVNSFGAQIEEWGYKKEKFNYGDEISNAIKNNEAYMCKDTLTARRTIEVEYNPETGVTTFLDETYSPYRARMYILVNEKTGVLVYDDKNPYSYRDNKYVHDESFINKASHKIASKKKFGFSADDHFSHMIRSGGESEHIEVAKSPFAPKVCAGIRELIDDPSNKVRLELAKNPNLKDEHIFYLLQDKDQEVREAVINQHGEYLYECSKSLSQRLADNDSSELIRNYAKKVLADRKDDEY